MSIPLNPKFLGSRPDSSPCYVTLPSEPLSAPVPGSVIQTHSSGKEGSWGFTDQSCSFSLSSPQTLQVSCQPLSHLCTPAPPGLLLRYPISITHSPVPTCLSHSAWLTGVPSIGWSPEPGTCMELGDLHCPGPLELTCHQVWSLTPSSQHRSHLFTSFPPVTVSIQAPHRDPLWSQCPACPLPSAHPVSATWEVSPGANQTCHALINNF